MSSKSKLISQSLDNTNQVNQIENLLLRYGQLVIYLLVLILIFFLVNSLQATFAEFLSEVGQSVQGPPSLRSR